MNEYAGLLLKIRVHPTLWFVAGAAVLTAHFTELFMLFTIVFIHEMGHAVCARHFKWRIKSILLLPFGGAMETEEYGNKNLKEDVAVILAGPFQHLWMMGAAYLAASLSLISPDMYDRFLYMNAAVLIFNLLPIYPLDGGRLLFVGLSFLHTFIDAHKYTLYLSTGFTALLFIIVAAAAPLNLNMWIIGFFLMFSLVMEWRQRYFAFVRFLLQRHYGRSGDLAQLKPIKVDENEEIYKVLELFRRGCKHPIIVLKEGKESGSLDETELLHAYFTEKMTRGRIGDLLYSY
ncbi:M50 family metallopeptidase [Bacillus massiliglaciei]|uniref:M50 family metallopeptidase n=1 Tax=Bacillus massiliglaciei TaxID=1816693 RepID=UPI000DA61CB3|nr:M50 family metallopeptidase [Bacillus massiliglaciei]